MINRYEVYETNQMIAEENLGCNVQLPLESVCWIV